jgi:hypothetical protein
MMRLNKLKDLSLETLSSQVLEFEVKARANAIGVPFRCFLGKLLVLPANVWLDWKVIARYKHSSLFGLIVSKCLCYKTFFLSWWSPILFFFYDHKHSSLFGGLEDDQKKVFFYNISTSPTKLVISGKSTRLRKICDIQWSTITETATPAPTRWQRYETFYGRKLQLFIIG